MNRFAVLQYYSRQEVIEQLLKNAQGREAVGAFWDGTFDQRPNIIQYPNDIVQMVKKGVTSFHFSVEHWSSPMLLRDSKKYDKLRTGFDIVFDFDSKIGIDGSQLAALLVCKELERYGIKNYGIKFSGSRGFHLIIPWATMPKEINYRPVAKQYPKIPNAIAEFIRSRISGQLMRGLIKLKGAKQLIDILEEPPEQLDPFYFVDLEKNWGPRHVFRAPYSLNEKKWLVSVPLSFNQLKNFKEDITKPDKISFNQPFFKEVEKDEAMLLLTEALDWLAKTRPKEEKKPQRRIAYTKKIPENLFPPCIKCILRGLPDGRKRSLFTLLNFLKMMNWPWQDIENKIKEWNEKNKGPLPRSIILGQLRWNQGQRLYPANCDNDQFYSSIGICKPDATCKKIKNPITYPFRRMPRIWKKSKKEKRVKMYKCDICNKAFTSMQGVYRHKLRMHGVE